MAIEFKLPELGENIEAGELVAVLVEEGAVVESGQHVIEIETDKAVVEVPCPHAGRVAKLHVKTGDRVPVGALLLTLEGDGQAPARADADRSTQPAPEAPPKRQPPPPAPVEEKASEPTAPVAPAATEAASASVSTEAASADLPPVPAGPAVRRLARELGVDLTLVRGTARAGRITTEDVQTFVRQRMSEPGVRPEATAAPLPDFSQWGPIERRRLSGIRRKTAEAMSLAWRLVPHVTQYDTADITELEAGRRRYMRRHSDAPAKITVTVMAVRAVVAALKAYPHFNASFDPDCEELILKQYYNIGVAVDTEHGLLVPVIRDADRQSVLELATVLDEMSGQARARKLALEQLRGGTFTISNLGGIGGTGFSPIVYYPEVAILGIARGRQEQVIVNGVPQVRLMLPLSLSYDHRVIDGADGARFLRMVAEMLSDPVRLWLDA